MTDRETEPTADSWAEFLDFYEETMNVEDVYVRVFKAPKGWMAWAAKRTELELAISSAKVEMPNYSEMPAYFMAGVPGVGATPLEAGQAALDAYKELPEEEQKKLLTYYIDEVSRWPRRQQGQ